MGAGREVGGPKECGLHSVGDSLSGTAGRAEHRGNGARVRVQRGV